MSPLAATFVALGVALVLFGVVVAVGMLLDRRDCSAASAEEDGDRCRTG